MNAYDFDNTIYNGESIVDFLIFCLKKDPSLIVYMPKAIYLLYLYKKNKLEIKYLEKEVEKLLSRAFDFNKYEKFIDKFWEKNYKKLKPEFLKMIKEDDLIITGCPSFLFEKIKKDIKAKHIICTDFDIKNNKLNFICLGDNKVKILKEKYPNIKINKFYTDSLMDTPMMDIASEVYFVNKKNIKRIK